MFPSIGIALKIGDGIEVWVKSQENEQDQKLADCILQELTKTKIQTNRGVKEGTSEDKTKDYYVNKYTKMPSCLIELGFISNKMDNQLLDENKEDYAKAIAKRNFAKFRNVEFQKMFSGLICYQNNFYRRFNK